MTGYIDYFLSNTNKKAQEKLKPIIEELNKEHNLLKIFENGLNSGTVLQPHYLEGLQTFKKILDETTKSYEQRNYQITSNVKLEEIKEGILSDFKNFGYAYKYLLISIEGIFLYKHIEDILTKEVKKNFIDYIIYATKNKYYPMFKNNVELKANKIILKHIDIINKNNDLKNFIDDIYIKF